MRKAKHMSVRKKILWSVAGLVLIIFGFTGYYVYSLYSFADNINKSPEDSIFSNIPSLTKTAELEPPKWEGKERVNILLLGGDSRGMGKNEIPRSDSLMIASLDPVTKKSYLFSILRDTYVDIPGQGSDRINAAIARGGPDGHPHSVFCVHRL
jgi:anionic cell wall polymer biosynthesis LytR-Cps2A-Psr (LCP) family protein